MEIPVCCFSRPVEHVSSTSIFARFVRPGHQALVYSMAFEASEDLAMVLPLPVASGSGEDAVEFVSLQGYADFFTDLSSAFPRLYAPASRGAFGAQSRSVAPLVVHDVGDFEASYVPTLGDFERLDPRFRLDPRVWDALPAYRDHGFAVFALKKTTHGGLLGFFKSRKRKTVHPMAFVFPTRRPDALFFPTVHIHDGEVHDEATFDHTLYCQLDTGAPAPQAATGPLHWDTSPASLGGFVDPRSAMGLVAGERPGWRAFVNGRHPNTDVWIATPG